MADESPAAPPAPKRPKWGLLANLASIIAALSLAFGVFQYVQKLEAQRAERTLDMIRIWNAEHRADLALLRDGIAAALEDPGSYGAGDIPGGIARRALREPGAETAFDDVVYFFNMLGLCIEAKVCSYATACLFFDQTLVNFADVFTDQIDQRAETLPGGTRAMTDLVERIGKSHEARDDDCKGPDQASSSASQ